MFELPQHYVMQVNDLCDVDYYVGILGYLEYNGPFESTIRVITPFEDQQGNVVSFIDLPNSMFSPIGEPAVFPN